MDWDTFHFSCRYLSNKLKTGLDLTSAQYSLHKNYSDNLTYKLTNVDIFRKIASIDNVDSQQKLFEIYGGLNFNRDNAVINKMSNLRIYLLLLFLVFLVLSAICLFYVIPTFKEILLVMDTPSNKHINNFGSYWLISVIIMSIVSILVLMLNTTINRISLYSSPLMSAITSKVILTNKVFLQIQKIEAIIYAPLGADINQFSVSSKQFVANLCHDNLHISKELQQRLDKEQYQLSKMLNARISTLMLVLSITVLLAICNFVFSLYAPIFYIGNI